MDFEVVESNIGVQLILVSSLRVVSIRTSTADQTRLSTLTELIRVTSDFPCSSS